jgi:hypothetical protein
MIGRASHDEIASLRDRLTWRDSDLVFSRHGRNLTRGQMRELDSKVITDALNEGHAVVLRTFESTDGALFEPEPIA